MNCLILRKVLRLAAFAVLLTFIFNSSFASSPKPSKPAPPPPVPPAPIREFRGLWIATVENIDWPSKPNLPAQQQKAELIAILNRAASLNFNAVVLQVRPTCDVIYPSRLEPWTDYLTGQMGVAPKPYYDPLAFAVSEAHKRGLELHAWFNPYRARFRKLTTPVAPNHITKTHPELVRPTEKYLWLDPSLKETRDYSLSVIMDVVRRYDIDGVHFDDYFYPYLEKGEVFHDENSWRNYQARGGQLSKADWRREGVNTFIQTVYRSIKSEKPWVKFGISPFGVWQPGYPVQADKKGLNAYEELYADARKWLANGWVDYMAPQLYWPIYGKQPFPYLLKWWVEQNPYKRNLWAGMNQSQEIGSQIALTRRQPGASGEIIYHAQSVMKNTNGLASSLLGVYAAPAVIPPSPWLKGQAPPQPLLKGSRGNRKIKLSWKNPGKEKLARWVIQKKSGYQWTTEVLPEDITSATFQSTPLPDAIAVSAMDRFGNLSPAAVFER